MWGSVSQDYGNGQGYRGGYVRQQGGGRRRDYGKFEGYRRDHPHGG